MSGGCFIVRGTKPVTSSFVSFETNDADVVLTVDQVSTAGILLWALVLVKILKVQIVCSIAAAVTRTNDTLSSPRRSVQTRCLV